MKSNSALSLHSFTALCLSFIPLLSLEPFGFFFSISASLSSSPATSCMYIYKSAHNWCLGRSKEQRGREAIRGIKRGAASQPSFTGQWSKSNWVLFSGRAHTYARTHARTLTHTHTHMLLVAVLELHTVADRRAFGTEHGWVCLQWTH